MTRVSSSFLFVGGGGGGGGERLCVKMHYYA